MLRNNPEGRIEVTEPMHALALPVVFEENGGQADPSAKFVARGRQHGLMLKTSEAVLLTRNASLSLKLVAANPESKITGENELPGKSYYATPATRGKLTPLATFARVRYSQVYPGVDLVYHGNDDQLEFDFVVAAHAKPDQIVMNFEDAERVTLQPSGELSLKSGGQDFLLRKPVIYQQRDGVRTEIAGGYWLLGGSSKQVRFKLGRYDKSLPLIIDPTILFGGYLGTTANEGPTQIKSDLVGNIYVAINTEQIKQVTPTQTFNIEPPQAGFSECFVTKISHDGSTILYTVVFGGVECGAMEVTPGKVHISMGKSGNYLRTLSEDAQGQPARLDLLYGNGPNTGFDFPYGPTQWMKADAAGNLYLIATNPDLSLPQVGNRLLKVDTSGNLVGSADVLTTLVVNNFVYDQITDLDVDDQGNAYVLGVLRDPSVITPTPNAFQPSKFSDSSHTDGFLLRVNANTFAIDYATYLGWTQTNFASNVASDLSSGNVYVAGQTGSLIGYNIYLLDLNLGLSGPSQQAGLTNIPGFQSGPQSLVVLPGGSPALTFSVFDNEHPFLVNSFYPTRSSQDVRGFLQVYSPGLTQLSLSTFLDATPSSSSLGPLLASGGQFLYAAMSTNDGNLGTSGTFQPSPEGGYDALVRSIDVTDLVAPTGNLPAVTLNPSQVNLTITTPTSGVDLPLICGQLFSCDVEYPLTGISVTVAAAWWTGPNVNLLQTGGFPSTTVHLPTTGTYQFTLTVKDPQGLTGFGKLIVNVNDENTIDTPITQTIILTDEYFNDPTTMYLGNVHPVTAVFPGGSVTQPGLTWLESRGDLNPAVPSGMQAGSPPFYYDIHTSAVLAPSALVNLCLDTTGMSFADYDDAQLFELQNGTWTAVASPQDFCFDTSFPTANGSDRVSTIAVFYPQVPQTSITAIGGTFSRPTYLAVANNFRGSTLYVVESGSPSLGTEPDIKSVDLSTHQVATLVPADGSQFGVIAVDPSDNYLYYDRIDASLGHMIVKRYLFPPYTEEVIAGGGACCSPPLVGQPATSGTLSDVFGMAVEAPGVYLSTSLGVFLVADDGNNTWRWILNTTSTPVSDVMSSPYPDLVGPLIINADGSLLLGGSVLVSIAPGPDGFVEDGTGAAVVVAGVPPVPSIWYAGVFEGDKLPATQASVASNLQMIHTSDAAVVFADGLAHKIRRINAGFDSAVNGGSDEYIDTIGGFFHPTAGDINSPFATSRPMDPRGVAQDPITGNILASNYADAGSVLSFGTQYQPATSPNQPPVVTAPADIVIAATEQGGARGDISSALHNFLLAATATDDHDSNPQQLAPQADLGGGLVNLSDQSLFPVGTTAVTFSFEDSSNAIGSAVAHVTVSSPVGGDVNTGGVPVTPTDPSNNNPLPLQLTFSGVTQPGLVTASVVMSPPAPPANFEFNGAVYDISTTAVYTPPVTVCFMGTGFTAADQLMHYENGTWINRTTLQTSTEVCGVVNSLSPFGVARAIAVELTTGVSPTGAGTVTPASGPVTLNAPVSLRAIANPGYSFSMWTGPVADSGNASTTVTPGEATAVTAYFTELPTSMSGNITAKTGTANARLWTVTLTNNGPGAANGAQITSFALTQVAGAACTPVVGTPIPAAAGNIAPAGSINVPVTVNFAGCAANARFTSTIQFSANSGSVSGTVVRYNQFE